MKTSELDPKDYKYIVAKPDSNFSPERNQSIIDETIKETNEYFKKLNNVDDDNFKERVDVLSSYAGHLYQKSGTKSLKDYLGKKLHARIVGEKILNRVKAMESADRFQNKFILS